MLDFDTVGSVCSCGAAAVAQLWPDKKLRSSPGFIIPCLLIYGVLSLAVWAISAYLQKDTIAMTKEHPGTPSIVLKSEVRNYGDDYKLTAMMKGASLHETRKSSSRQSFGNMFTSSAEIQKEVVHGMVNDLLHQLDAPSESSNGTKKDM